MPRIICVASGKGGVGKTVCAVNLALALYQFGEKVVVVDADMTASNLGIQLGHYAFPNNLQSVIRGEVEPEMAVHTHPSGINFIPSSIALNDISVKPRNLGQVLRALPHNIIIVDAPPGLDTVGKGVLEASDEVLVVTTPEIPAVANAAKTIKMAEEYKKRIIGIVVNRYTGDESELKPEEIEMICEAPIVGVIPEDDKIKKSLFHRTPLLALDPYCSASIAFKKIAAGLIGKVYQPPRFLTIRRLFGII